ncbi:Cadherin-like [Paracoccus alcaliphilus]|uniref:Cadherin-like n=2 Tax=Paracoccus alcaliphilus TaxID=34002 RepID=A0A1H8J4U6_9RHOB|nr:Cadherin-like [Paracoccus alcaliphilus]
MEMSSKYAARFTSASHAEGLSGRIFTGSYMKDPLAYLSRQDGEGVANFTAERLNYNAASGRIADFLGNDADFDRPALAKRGEMFGMRLDGEIYLEAGTHRFRNLTDDGFRLTIGKDVVAQYGDGANYGQARTDGSITIKKAGWYDIGIDYFQGVGAAQLQVRHSHDGGQMKVLGSEPGRLRHEVAGGWTDSNSAPVARDDRFTVEEDGAVRMNLLANDRDADGDDLSIVSLEQPSNGQVTLNPNGTVTYRPNADFSGSDSFTYVISDGRGGKSTASVEMTVEAQQQPVANRAPVAVNDSGFSVAPGQMLHINPADLLANDRDADGDSLSVIRIGNVSGGTASMSDGMIHFTGGEAGTATFNYVISDGNGGTDRGRVTVEVGANGGNSGGGHTDHDGGTGGNTGGGNSGGGNTGGTGGGHGNHGGGHDLITPPQTSAQIQAFLREIINAPEHTAHHPAASPDHDGSLQLVPRAEATHIAIAHGDWNDPSIWQNGQVPGADAKVLIPEGIAVTYGAVNNASLFTVRVDGVLDFATDHDSRMLVDTMVVSPSGHLIMGTEDNPVRSNVNIDIVFADNGNIDTGWDPSLLSRGLLSHGSVTIHGEEKSSHVKVEVDAMAGDNRLTLSEVPDGWKVGDKLVLTGTHQQGWDWNNDTRRVEKSESQDEEVTIRSINGNQIVLDQRLQYDHDTPRDDLKAYVANMTRNVTFSSEGGDDLPVHQRGHVMFMHSDDIDVRYAGFNDLGRTDKSRPAFDINDLGGPGAVATDANIQTRYPFHFHETGVTDLENPAMAVGNVVDGSPGWGYVHHSSNANFTNNVAFDVFGAAFVAEDGNETGIWYRNIAINSDGVGYGDWTVKWQSDVERGDNGRTGDGYFFAGRLVEAAENVAANTTNGYVWLHRGDRDAVDFATSHHPELGYGQTRSRVDQTPIQGFYDNEAFGTNTGIIVVKANPDQGHDVRSVFDGFLNWETREGINASYTSHYTFLNVDLVGQRAENGGFSGATGAGVVFGTNTFDMVVNGATIRGFQNAYDLQHNDSTDGVRPQDFRNIAIDSEHSNIRGAVAAESVGGQLRMLDSSQLVSDRLRFDFTGDRTIGQWDNMFFDGTKYDSIGAIDRIFDMEQQGLWTWDKDALLSSQGYHRLADGTPVLLVADYIADRATGQLSKHTLVFELDFNASQLSGYTDHGTVTLGGPAPIANNDRATTQMNQSVRLDLVANDRDPDGGRVYVDGLTDPRNGDVFLQDDGTVLYRPNTGFSGNDSFYYWAADEEGNFTQARADIVVTEMMMTDSFDF